MYTDMYKYGLSTLYSLMALVNLSYANPEVCL